MNVNLQGQVALITGAAGGIGRAICSALAANGARVVYADINIEAARQCAAQTPGAIALRMDVTNEAEVEAVMAETVAFLVARGIPVLGHLGLTPQSVHTLGGYRVQGKTEDAAQRLLDDAKLLQEAGAASLVLECVPSPVGRQVTEALSIPTIGIGGGPHCDGQILILHDMLDVYPGKKAKFVKNYMQGAASIQEAIQNYVREVKSGAFPSPEYCFS
jgi:3-methyl-2-oxobutanoate hydroxymethyltransferase